MEFESKLSRMTDLRILETILASIDTGHAPAPIAEAKQDFLRLLGLCETEGYNGELWEYLKDHPKLTRISVVPTARRVLEMIREEVKKYTTLKAERPLTQEEERYVREEVLPLLLRVQSLVGWAAGKSGGPGK